MRISKIRLNTAIKMLNTVVSMQVPGTQRRHIRSLGKQKRLMVTMVAMYSAELAIIIAQQIHQNVLCA